jgi:hypothetical protein
VIEIELLVEFWRGVQIILLDQVLNRLLRHLRHLGLRYQPLATVRRRQRGGEEDEDEIRFCEPFQFQKTLNISIHPTLSVSCFLKL